MAMDDKLKDKIDELVKEALSNEALSGVEKDAVEVLEAAKETVAELLEKLAEREAKAVEDSEVIETLESSVAELKVELSSRDEKLSDIEKAKTELEEELSETKAVLDKLEKDLREKARMSELEENEVAWREGDRREEQKTKVREMSDEEFSAYRDELIDFRSELISSAESKSNSDEGSKKDAKLDDSPADGGGEGGEVTPPMDVGAALEMSSVNIPSGSGVATEEDIKSRYKDFGVKLAGLMEKLRGEDATK